MHVVEHAPNKKGIWNGKQKGISRSTRKIRPFNQYNFKVYQVIDRVTDRVKELCDLTTYSLHEAKIIGMGPSTVYIYDLYRQYIDDWTLCLAETMRNSQETCIYTAPHHCNGRLAANPPSAIFIMSTSQLGFRPSELCWGSSQPQLEKTMVGLTSTQVIINVN